jgi:hypothetical protein
MLNCAKLLTFVLLSFSASAGELERNFARPPASARPWVFWFWLNGNITSNGITADLEAMQRVGIGGVAIMDVDQGTPKGPITFNSPEWINLFKHTCGEARRLGLQVNINNDAGWAGSGGPWITPELSMQKLVWSETTIEGGKGFDGALKQPETVRGFYRDVGVLAFPATEGEAPLMRDCSPRITASVMKPDFDQAKLMDGDFTTGIGLPRPDPGKPQFVQVEFPKPFRARRIALKMPGLTSHKMCHAILEKSDDGTNFTTIREFNAEAAALSVNFPETEARIYRVFFNSAETYLEALAITEIELSPYSRIDNYQEKALFVPRSEYTDTTNYAVLPSETAIRRGQLIDLSGRMAADGRLHWDAPEGKWTVLRFGHTSTGEDNQPAPESGRGLECDKLSKAGSEAAFNGFIGKLIKAVGRLAGKTFAATHVDSWEVGAQNWTANFRKEFQRLRGYDPMPYLPVMTGRVVESLDISERFLWDLRQTVSEMLVENYSGGLSELARRHGMYLTMEAYDLNPCDDLMFAGRVDQPMAEFWTWPPYGVAYSCAEMTSAAHVYGKPIASGEAFTATDTEKWLGHPYGVKVFGDWAFCQGINRFILHRYAHQPWTDPTRYPGMTMGPWGLHYERTQTWWEQSKPWHEYLSRCQYLLQQGLFSADICYVSAEESPNRWYVPGKSRERPGYNYDACPAELVINKMSVKNGRVTLPDGMSYRLLVSPDSETMTPKLLLKIRSLVDQGATVLGKRPKRSPSLSNYPECDAELERVADELWADADGMVSKEHRLGKGRVICGKTPEEALSGDQIPADFAASSKAKPQAIRYIHKIIGDKDLYFVANKYSEPEDAVCVFRVSGKTPEFLKPDTGVIEHTAVFEEKNGTIQMPIHFDSFGSVFVLFSPEGGNGHARSFEAVRSVTRNGKEILNTLLIPEKIPLAVTNESVTNSFTMACWVKPEIEIDMPEQANAGISGLHVMRNDVLYPPPGEDLYEAPKQAGAGISVGNNGVCVYEHAAAYFAPTLVYATPITNWTHVAVVYSNETPILYLNGKLAHRGIRSDFNVHSGVGVPHNRGVAPFRGVMGDPVQFERALSPLEVADLMKSTPLPEITSETPAIELSRDAKGCRAEVRAGGAYAATTSTGKREEFNVRDLPAPIAISGPWKVYFPPRGGAPASTRFDELAPWNENPDPGIKYFSGTATYETTFEAPGNVRASGRKVYINLGRVAVMAEVDLNGAKWSTLWKPPFELEVTDAIKAGANVLKIKVTNLWPNRMIGDEQLPEDSKRKENGTLEEWPEWLLKGDPSPTSRHTFTTWRLWKKDGVLQQSGLLGPVKLSFGQEIRL